MIGIKLWSGSMGEREGRDEEVTGKVFEMGVGDRLKYIRVYGEGEIAEGDIKEKGRDEDLGVREENGKWRR